MIDAIKIKRQIEMHKSSFVFENVKSVSTNEIVDFIENKTITIASYSKNTKLKIIAKTENEIHFNITKNDLTWDLSYLIKKHNDKIKIISKANKNYAKKHWVKLIISMIIPASITYGSVIVAYLILEKLKPVFFHNKFIKPINIEIDDVYGFN